MTETPLHAPSNPDVAYERSDVDPRLLAGIAAGLVATVAIVLVALRIGFPVARDRAVDAPQGRLPPAPQLQADPARDLAVFRRAEDDALSSYGWIDRSRGIVRVPIDEAMRKTLERGLPGWTRSAP